MELLPAIHYKMDGKLVVNDYSSKSLSKRTPYKVSTETLSITARASQQRKYLIAHIAFNPATFRMS